MTKAKKSTYTQLTGFILLFWLMVRLETAPTAWNQVNWVLRATRDKQITCVYFNTIFKWYFSLYAYIVTL